MTRTSQKMVSRSPNLRNADVDAECQPSGHEMYLVGSR
jgi:hypothetical protein